MKKFCIALLIVSLLFISSCAPDYSYSEDISDDWAEINYDILDTVFYSQYYNSLGAYGLEEIHGYGAVSWLHGISGMLLYANTPTRMIFRHSSEPFIWNYYEYDKLTGKFSYACHDILCEHDNCMFSLQYKISASDRHIFFAPEFDSRNYYVSALSGENIQSTDIPADGELLSDTEKGLYWCKHELDGEQLYYSLWLYDFSSKKSNRLTEPAQNVIYYVLGDTVYYHDIPSLTLYRLSEGGNRKTEIASGVTELRNFGGVLYDYDYITGEFKKLQDGKMVSVATVPSVIDYWASDGFIYFCFNDKEKIQESAGEEELYQYLSSYNQTCGNVYRVKEFENTPELVYHGAHDGKPDLIDYVFADGEVVYIQYRDYKNFPNNFNNSRGVLNLVILDVPSGESIAVLNSPKSWN